MGSIEGYTSATSVSPGQSLAFHVHDDDGPFTYEIYRIETLDVLMTNGEARAAPYATPANAHEIGCGWPAAFTLTIPEAWSSGVYVARLSSAAGRSRDIAFIVRSAHPGKNARILVAIPVNTTQAYNGWGGKSLYAFNSSDHVPATRVSFDRPTDGALVTEQHYLFVRWLAENGFAVDYATSIDLDADPGLLSQYQLLVSIGHDEYWSRAMRDNVEAFIARGGNVAFFSGNVCWWQVRFELEHRTMVCHKSVEDPVTAVDPSQATVLWSAPPLGRPENMMTGVSYRNGAGWWNDDAGARPAVDYRVHFSRHWVFAGTGLEDGDRFGGNKRVVGSETDAAQFVLRNGVPEVTSADGTPRNFVILASADLTRWRPAGKGGWATLGLFRRRGVVFTAATTGWVAGLVSPIDAVQVITANVLTRLSEPNAASPPVANAELTRWTGDVPAGWSREGAGALTQGASPFNGQGCLAVDATPGMTRVRQRLELLEGRSDYRVSGWVKASAPGATLRLESARTRTAFAVAEHPGAGEWQYVTAVGRVESEGPLFPAEVVVQLDGGTALFARVTVEAL